MQQFHQEFHDLVARFPAPPPPPIVNYHEQQRENVAPQPCRVHNFEVEPIPEFFGTTNSNDHLEREAVKQVPSIAARFRDSTLHMAH